jgi:predicted amidohydrolase YtcJ
MHPILGQQGAMVRALQMVLAGLISLSIASAAHAQAKSELVTTIYVNAHVFTAEYSAPYAQAVAIRGDRILAVGSQTAVEKIAGKSSRIVDLHGQFLMPGMIDAHAHPVMGGMTLIMASYPDETGSIPNLISFIGKQLDEKKSFIGDTLVIHDLDLGFWSHSAELDAILSHDRYAAIPIVLNGSDGHTGWANLAARQRAGLTSDYLRSLSAEKQKFFGVGAEFNPNGFVVDFGKNMIDQSLSKPSPEMMLAAGGAGVHYMNSVGITGWLDAAAVGDPSGAALEANDSGTLPIYQELAKRGMLTAHVAAYPVVSPDAGIGQIALVEKLRKQFATIPNLTIPGLKIFADGVVEYPSQTAAMIKPYINSGQVVSPMFTQTAMNAMVVQADKRGLLVHVHAIGDGAVKAALDAFEVARKANPAGKLKHTITHAQFVESHDQQRFAHYNVIATLQLFWALAEPSTVELIKPYVDPAAYQTMYPARSLLEAGVEIAGASDWPVTSAAPFAAMYQAEVRKGPEGILFPEQRMPRLAMLYAYTRNSADVLNQLTTIGSIAPGKRADLVLVDRDVLTVSADELKEAKILATMFAGKTVFGDGL